jgi:hypothetical protein
MGVSGSDMGRLERNGGKRIVHPRTFGGSDRPG